MEASSISTQGLYPKTILTQLQQRFKQLYQQRLVNLILFGSYARNEAKPGSDIDVLVVLKGPVHPGEEIARVGHDTAALSLQYDAVISCTFMSAERFNNEHSPLLLNIRREGIRL